MALKPKRIVDKDLLKWIKTNARCIACFGIPADPHHVKARGMGGAGGDDIPSNLMPLCRVCHQNMSAPWRGIGWMIRTYPNVRMWLLATGNERFVEKCCGGHYDT